MTNKSQVAVEPLIWSEFRQRLLDYIAMKDEAEFKPNAVSVSLKKWTPEIAELARVLDEYAGHCPASKK